MDATQSCYQRILFEGMSQVCACATRCFSPLPKILLDPALQASLHSPWKNYGTVQSSICQIWWGIWYVTQTMIVCEYSQIPTILQSFVGGGNVDCHWWVHMYTLPIRIQVSSTLCSCIWKLAKLQETKQQVTNVQDACLWILMAE